MCEFCTEHGEGKKWYLQMKNYSDELLYQELTSNQRDIIKAETRVEWRDKFYEKTIIPACRNVKKSNNAMKSAPQPTTKLSDEEALAQRKVMHFGQVLPLEDVEKVIDMVDSITRMPCGCRYKTTGKEDKRYCFGIGVDKLGILGKYPDAASSLEVLNREETKELFQKFDKEGLILHTLRRLTFGPTAGELEAATEIGLEAWLEQQLRLLMELPGGCGH